MRVVAAVGRVSLHEEAPRTLQQLQSNPAEASQCQGNQPTNQHQGDGKQSRRSN